MGYYINENSNGTRLPNCNKADYLILDGAVEIKPPKKFVPNLVCVLENDLFDAALYCYEKSEMDVALNSTDLRPKRWLIYDKAAKLSGYNL